MATKKLLSVAGRPGLDPVLPRVPITLNGNKFHLAYDFNAIARAEELTGLNLLSSMDFTNLSVVKFRALLFASLLKDQPDLTLAECGSFITINNIGDITVKMVEAWVGSRPVVEEEKGNEEAGAAE